MTSVWNGKELVPSVPVPMPATASENYNPSLPDPSEGDVGDVLVVDEEGYGLAPPGATDLSAYEGENISLAASADATVSAAGTATLASSGENGEVAVLAIGDNGTVNISASGTGGTVQVTADAGITLLADVAVLGNVGFYATAPVAQQTGVTVDAAGIHAALVALGLITA